MTIVANWYREEEQSLIKKRYLHFSKRVAAPKSVISLTEAIGAKQYV
jgi:hypothetical protein